MASGGSGWFGGGGSGCGNWERRDDPIGIFESLLHKNVQRNYLAYVFNCNLYVLPAPQRVKLDVEDVKTQKCDQPPLPRDHLHRSDDKSGLQRTTQPEQQRPGPSNAGK